jgi:hypothetical protein
MKVPDKFPAGCKFMSSFGGDEFVKFPDGNWFRLDEDAVELVELKGAPVSKGCNSDEAYFLRSVAEAKRANDAAKAA